MLIDEAGRSNANITRVLTETHPSIEYHEMVVCPAMQIDLLIHPLDVDIGFVERPDRGDTGQNGAELLKDRALRVTF